MVGKGAASPKNLMVYRDYSTKSLMSTPTEAIKVILDLPLLHIYVQGIAKSTAHIDLYIVKHQ